MSVIKHEIKSNFKSLIIWTIGTIFFILVSMVKGEGFIGNPEMNDLMQSMPKGVSALFGMTGLDVSTFIGYYGVIYIYFVIAVTFYNITQVNSILLTEQIDKISDYLYVKPIKRKVLVFYKLLASFILNFIYQLVVLIVAYGYFSTTIDDLDLSLLVSLHLHGFLISLMFMGISIIVIMLRKGLKSGVSVTVLIFLIMYVIQTLYQLFELPEFLTYLSPLVYFSAVNIIDDNLKIIYYIITITPLIIGYILTYILFDKKEIN